MARFGASTGWVGRHRLAVTSWIALSLVTACLVALAVRSQGYPVHRADLNNGGVWVTDSKAGLIGRENHPIKQLDLRIDGASSANDQLDVLQNQEAVIAVDRSANLVTPVDTSQGTASKQSAVTVKSPDVQLGGATVAVTDPATGKIWAAQVSTAGGDNALDALDASSKPLSTIGGQAALTVSTSGTVYAASVSTGKLTTITPLESGFAAPTVTMLSPTPSGAIKQMTTVGAHVVWLDAQGNVGFDGHRVAVGEGAQLQQPGPDSDAVLVDTPTKLLSLPLGGGSPVTLFTASGSTTASAPVDLGGCAWGLWASGSHAYVAQKCGSSATTWLPPFPVSSGADLVYRVNRTNLFVNDMTNGAVYDVDGKSAVQVSDWQSLDPKHNQKSDSTHQVVSDQPAKPQAVHDNLGARAGDTTVLHVLDNDKAPRGDTLAITAFRTGNPKVTVQVAPDQQTLLATVNQGVVSGTPVPLSYTIDDGEKSNNTATGTVTLTVHGPDDSAAQPQLRQNYASSKAPPYPVASGGSIDIPVLSDWRDRTNGDPVSLVPGSVKASLGKASITPDGVIRYVAPQGGHLPPTVSIGYDVTTGGPVNHGTSTVHLVTGTDVAPPIAEPDVSAGDVGSAIVIHPLDNDVAGADPVDPTAALALSGNVAPLAGLTVKTDPANGTVIVVGHHAGSYTLPYHVGYGSAAAPARSTLRVIVSPTSKTSGTPIAMPDTTAVHGSSPMLVDVLANDYDPQGRLLAVQQATQSNQSGARLKVAVVDGRWLRVSNPSGQSSQKPAVVEYQVTNGRASAPGTLTVSLQPALDPVNDAPDAEPDVVTVRAGTSADIPVLDNDSTPSGDPVGLAVDPSVTPGTLPVTDGPGAAYLDGKYVRFVAPLNVSKGVDTHFSYAVENTSEPDAGQSSGLVTVHITPAPDAKTNPDQAPTPSDLEGRVVEGDTVTLKLPLTDQDPDGDPVAVSGIGDAGTPNSTPQLGQVVGYSADTISYQAFPGQTGEDQFTYTVTDPYGRPAQATVRLTVVAPGAPQAPVAVDDTVTADPGRDLTIDVLANDLIPEGTTPVFQSFKDPTTKISGSNGVVTVKHRARTGDLVVPYEISNGLESSGAHLTVHFRQGFDNPPQTSPVTATPTARSHSVTADVLAKVSDIDDDASHLKLVSVDHRPSSAIHGGSVTLPVSAQPRVWTYHVRDAEGAEAVGTIYEAGRPTATPYLKKGAVLHLKPGTAATVDISKYVETPAAGTKPYLTTDDEIFQAPSRMFAGPMSTPSQQQIKLSPGRVAGPATLSFQVSDQKNFNSKSAHTAMISLPVVIGDPQPVLTCPTSPVGVPETGSVDLSIGAICHVWQQQGQLRQLSYSAALASSTAGISVSNGTSVVLKAVHAKVGAQGLLDVKVAGSSGAAAHLPFIVTQVPPPTLQPIPTLHPQAGHTATIDLGRYLVAGIKTSVDPAVVKVAATNGGPAAKIGSGTTVSITPPPDEHKTYTYQVVMSDSGKDAGSDRTATGTLSVQVTDVPHFPAGARPSVVGNLPQSDQVTLRWPAADPYGSPLAGYRVKSSAGTKSCATTLCTISGLKNGTTYSFTVTAVNANGVSAALPAVSAEPDDTPGQVSGPRITAERNESISYQWSPPSGDFSKVTGYLVSWTGHNGYVKTSRTTQTIGIPNGTNVTFSVRPYNELFEKYGNAYLGPKSSADAGVASGRPDAPNAPGITGTNVAGGDTKAFTVSWGPVAPNGRGVTHYELFRDGSSTPVACGAGGWTTSTSCSVQVGNDGTSHSFRVKAANDAGWRPTALEGGAASHVSSASPATSAVAAGTPDGFSNVSLTPTGNNGEATLTFTVGKSHGKSGTVTCTGAITCPAWDVGTSGGTFTKTVTGFANGQNQSITLSQCNGADANAGLETTPCVDSSPVSVTTYGPLGQPTISASASGTTITVNTSGDGNGAAATLKVTDTDTGASKTCGPSSAGFSCQLVEGGLAYSRTYHFTVTLSDASGHGRAAKTGSASATTDPPPPPSPTVTVTKGANHVVTQGSGSCTRSPGCPYVVTTTKDFTSSVHCKITRDSINDLGGFLEWDQGANATQPGPDVYASGWVIVTCTDGQGHSASGKGQW